MTSITPSDLQARIARGETVELIDVRTTLEWNAGHALGARHVPLAGLDPATVIATRTGRPEDPLYVICASGGRSAAACAAFQRAGFAQAVNVEGGTSAWSRAGLPMERRPGAAALGLLLQIGLLAGVAAAVLYLMPCSPLTLWGPASCPAAPASDAAPAASGPDRGGKERAP
jgi:rhodanese-related sulfurtransferase